MAAPPRVEFRLAVEARIGPAPLNQQPYEFRAGVLHFTAAHFSGSLDVAQRTGRVALTAPDVADAVDYVVRAALALLAFEAGGLLFHATGLVEHDRGFAFFGPSGSGKTTVARLSPQATVLNDDLIVLWPQADRWLMFATPFGNPVQWSSNRSPHAPLTALLRLVQDQHVLLDSLPTAEAAAEIIASSPIVSTDPDRATALIERAARLVHSVPAQQLHFRPDASFWAIVDQQYPVPEMRS
jgi:hypothetical protein